MRRVKSGLIGCLLVVFAVAGCGGRTMMKAPSEAAERNVAARFAAALLVGDSTGALALLAPADDGALVFLVQQAVTRWRSRHGSIQLLARPAGPCLNGDVACKLWTLSYSRRRTYSDGRFEVQRGELVVFLAPSAAGVRVEFFAFRNVRTRFSTHHDSQLPPSKR